MNTNPTEPTNIIPLVDEKKQKRPHLADMMALPKKYRIGKNDEGRKVFVPLNAEEDYTKDQIISIIGQAYPELVSFLKEVDQLKEMYSGACDTIRIIYEGACGKFDAPKKDVVQDIQDAVLKGRRAMDVLRSIAYNIAGNQPGKAQAVAKRFFEEEKRRES